MSNLKPCIIYSILRIMADEKVFVDYDTLETLPIITKHLMESSQACPDVMYKHEFHFSGPDAEAKKVAFMQKPLFKDKTIRPFDIMQTYIDTYLRDKPGPKPSLPEWEALIPENPMSSAALEALYNSEKKDRKRTRKQQKSRKQTRKQQKKQIKRK
jgi:hypothetical protein